MVRPAVVLTGILLAATLAGCGGSAVTEGGTTAVTVTIGGDGASAASAAVAPRATPRPMGAAIPPTVTAIRFTIGGAGIADIVQTVPVTGTTMSVTLQVPSGPGRTILVEALDAGGVSRFRGVATIDASGIALSVTIDMAIDPSNPALRTWTLVDNTASSTLNRIVEGDGILLAGGAGPEILSSVNGNTGTWTSFTSGNLDLRIAGLAFGNQTFLVMNSTLNTAVPGVTNHFFSATSDNVADWTPRMTVVTDNPLANLAFGGGTFVAVGDNNVFHSQDNGATWSRGTISGVPYLSDVAYGNGRFVAIDGWSGIVAVSTDNGISWTSSVLDPSSINGIRFGGGLFMVATQAGTVYTSADGVAWQLRTPIDLITGMTEPSVSSVVYGGGGFLVIVSDISVDWIFFTFDQGESWIPVTLAAYGAGVQDGTFFNGAFLVVGDDRGSGRGGVFRSGEL